MILGSSFVVARSVLYAKKSLDANGCEDTRVIVRNQLGVGSSCIYLVHIRKELNIKISTTYSHAPHHDVSVNEGTHI
jgi:hypothetical protein